MRFRILIAAIGAALLAVPAAAADKKPLVATATGGFQQIQSADTLSVPALKNTGITGSTQCLQVNSAGLVSGTGSACGTGSGSVATTGSPASGNLAKFSGAATITNGDLSGDCTTSGALAVTCTKTGGVSFGALATASSLTEAFCVAISDETTALTTGAAKVTFRMPYAFTLTGVRFSVNTASSSGNPTVDINEAGTSILSTALSIDSGEKTSVTAATAAVISDSSLASDAEMTVDQDTAGTGAKGGKVCLIGHQ